VRIQPRRGKPRNSAKVFYDPAVEAAVRRDMIRWKSSRSWILHTVAAAFYEIDIVTPQAARPKAKSKLRLVRRGSKRRAA
jgi:hypothetical protein